MTLTSTATVLKQPAAGQRFFVRWKVLISAIIWKRWYIQETGGTDRLKLTRNPRKYWKAGFQNKIIENRECYSDYSKIWIVLEVSHPYIKNWLLLSLNWLFVVADEKYFQLCVYHFCIAQIQYDDYTSLLRGPTVALKAMKTWSTSHREQTLPNVNGTHCLQLLLAALDIMVKRRGWLKQNRYSITKFYFFICLVYKTSYIVCDTWLILSTRNLRGIQLFVQVVIINDLKSSLNVDNTKSVLWIDNNIGKDTLKSSAFETESVFS